MSLQEQKHINKPWKLRAASLIAASFLLTASVVGPPALANTSVDPNIPRLEKRFFQHEYPKDTVESRVERLEKMIFGEAKTGAINERITSLVASVPQAPEMQGTPDTQVSEESPPPNSRASQIPPAEVADLEDKVLPGANYPAVTAIENRLLGKSFENEPVRKRLDRLEVKVFGKVSDISDMTDRMDRLKAKTGVDAAKQAPAGSDWADEDEYLDHPPISSKPQSSLTYSNGEDGKSFSGRNIREDMQRAFGTPNSQMPSVAPGFQQRPAAPPSNTVPGTGPGLNQQVTYLEQLIFGKTYTSDSLPARVNRLELTMFPQQPLAVTTPLPDRVKRILGTVPGAPPNSGNFGNGGANFGQSGTEMGSAYEDFTDMDYGDVQSFQQRRTTSPYQSQPRSSGLNKIINSIGGMMGGGYGGGYTTRSGTFVTDPQTGLLYDPSTGVLVDPMTGTVVGQRYPTTMPGASPYGGFNNGFSQFGAPPYGMGSGSSLRFGFGGIGGMWP